MPPKNHYRQGNPYNNYGMWPNQSNWMGINYGNNHPGLPQRSSSVAPRYGRANRGGGGLLSRLLGGSRHTARSANPFQFGSIASTRTSGIPGWLNPNSISRFLGQTQQILHTGHQISGMVQQYGPIIKNLPALWKIYRSVNSTTEDKEQKEDTALNTEQHKEQEKEKLNNEHHVLTEEEILEIENDELIQDFDESKEKNNNDTLHETVNKQAKYQEKKSMPKLFI